MEDHMLLERSDVVVVGGEVRLLDFVIPRLDLRPVMPLSSPISVFAVLTLGSPGQTFRMKTSAFDSEDVEQYAELEGAWKGHVKADRYDRPFLEYLLRYFLSSAEFKLEFILEGERLTRFVVTLGKRLQLQGRFPNDVDILGLYFSPVLSMTD